ncbi:MAG: hypothetical protein QXO49_03610 [Candidatus Bathyarchaeia archaeon]
MDPTKNVRLTDQKETVQSKLSIGLKIASKTLETLLAKVNTNMKKDALHTKQKKFPATMTTTFLFNELLSGKSINMKRMLKTSSTCIVSVTKPKEMFTSFLSLFKLDCELYRTKEY